MEIILPHYPAPLTAEQKGGRGWWDTRRETENKGKNQFPRTIKPRSRSLDTWACCPLGTSLFPHPDNLAPGSGGLKSNAPPAISYYCAELIFLVKTTCCLKSMGERVSFSPPSPYIDLNHAFPLHLSLPNFRMKSELCLIESRVTCIENLPSGKMYRQDY